MRLKGRYGIWWLVTGGEAVTQAHPLLIVIHEWAYSSAYFEVPGYSLLDRAQRNRIPAIAIDSPGSESTPFQNEMSILGQAATLRDALVSFWDHHRGSASGIALIGHSSALRLRLNWRPTPGNCYFLALQSRILACACQMPMPPCGGQAPRNQLQRCRAT